ncbi:MAG: dynamin family protein [Lentisphaeria bacterium]|nr:dynamin family protein [Lentisphaeria bacterium]
MSYDLASINQKLSGVLKKLELLKADYPGLADEMQISINSFAAAVSSKLDDGRLLSISIVGRVKSGKSSLLNALIFDGESVLPQAATPMTAALTFIRYAPECHAEIEFFSSEDWDIFVRQAREYDAICAEAKAELIAEDEERTKRAKAKGQVVSRREITEQRIADRAKAKLNENFIAAHELVEMAEREDLDLDKLLGSEPVVIKAKNPVALSGKLEEYVGAHGKYTPIVCSTAIYINDPRLEGYEIIDTPGTNDPVISRGQRTKQHLKKTDVVLAMSMASEFFNQSDLELLSQNLPQSGVKDFLLLASQFDLTVSEHENKIPRDLTPYDRLVKGFVDVQKLIQESFHDRVDQIARQAVQQKNGDAEKWNFLLTTEAICVSSMAFILARHWDNLTDREKENLARFNEIIPGYTFDRKALEEFSRMHKVHEALDSVKSKKMQIIAESVKNLVEAGRKGFAEQSRSLRNSIQASIEALQSKDVAQLAKELKVQTTRLEKGRSSLEGCFEDAIYGARDKFSTILSEIRQSKAQFANLTVQSESHTETEDYTVDKGCGFLWWRSWTGNRYETRTRSYTVTTRYADAYEAVDQVESFANQARSMLENAIRSAVNVSELKNNISDAILALFENGTEDIDLDLLKEQIKAAVRRITIPDADFGDVDYSAAITSKFSGSRVEDSDIDSLKAAQRAALSAVISDLEKKAKEKTSAIEKCLTTTKETFVNRLIGDLKADNEKLAEQLKNKKESLKHLKTLIPVAAEIEETMNNL